LRELNYDVIYIDVLHEELTDLVVVLAGELLKKWRRKRIALLVDEVFQAIGVGKAEIYVKTLLNLIEYPP
jgi:hypothetical protein